MKQFNYSSIILVIALLLSACNTRRGTGQSIQVQDAWVRAAIAMETNEHGSMATPESEVIQGPGAISAAYLLIYNNGNSSDRLLRAESEIAQVIEFHRSEMNGEVMTMRLLDSVELPANGEAELRPGGIHLMLIGLKQDLKPGDRIPLVLIFENAGEIHVLADVRAP